MILAGCDPVTGTGSGTPPSPDQYIHVDTASKSAVVTLIAGHPAGDYQFNYDGYYNGTLQLTVPVGWEITLQCENHATIPSSCAIVADGGATSPLQPGWATPPLEPGRSAAFSFTPTRSGSYRIASLVEGSEASGMWARLSFVDGGIPALIALGG
jgi:hypothetical protein